MLRERNEVKHMWSPHGTVSEKQNGALQEQERDQKALAGQCGMQKASKTRGRARAGHGAR